MKFFTDKTVINDYLLIKLKDYIKLKDFSRWKEIFIDPGVYDLTKSDKFKWEGTIDIEEFLDSLPGNHYFSWDYPSDMNEDYSLLFRTKTWNRAVKYHEHPNYIVTVQSRFQNYWNFTDWFDLYNQLPIKSGLMGLGNMCRFRSLNMFLKHALDYAFKHSIHPRMHIYGLCLQAIPYANNLAKKYNIDLSIDNTKWTFMFYEQDSKDRQVQFDLYMDKIRNKGVILD